MDEVIAPFTLVDLKMRESTKARCTEQEICEYQYLRSFPFKTGLDHPETSPSAQNQ
jgi:hypothetical protein